MSAIENPNEKYRKALKEFRKRFKAAMLSPPLNDMGTNPTDRITWNVMDLWATAILMDEAVTLSRLTRVLAVLTLTLVVLTGVLTYYAVRAFHP